MDNGVMETIAPSFFALGRIRVEVEIENESNW
jgi:hypothetical protein